MFSLFKRSSARKKRFTHLQIFTVEAPDSWRQNNNPKYLSLTDAADVAAVTANAFAKRDGGSLADFAETRFAAVAEMKFYSQNGDERRFQANDRDFITREFSGTWPDETELTYYLVACAELESAYVSLTVTTKPDDFLTNKQLYMEIITSVKPADSDRR